MVRTFLHSGVGLAALLVAGLGMGAEAQDGAIPALASASFGWQPASGLDFLPVEGQVAPIPRGGPAIPGVERMSDDANANLTPRAAAIMKQRNDKVRGGQRAFTAQSRCWPGGVPGQLVFVAEPIHFIQTPQEVWIVWERDHHVRRVYLDRPHSANPRLSWFGEFVGHYENGELVVDTIGLIEHEFSAVDNYHTPHSKDLHVVERWKIVEGGTMLEATVTVEDKAMFKAPWTGRVRWRKANRGLAEWVCAENNLGYEQLFDLAEYPMPVANRPDF
jgi:hypothetical protein